MNKSKSFMVMLEHRKGPQKINRSEDIPYEMPGNEVSFIYGGRPVYGIVHTGNPGNTDMIKINYKGKIVKAYWDEGWESESYFA